MEKNPGSEVGAEFYFVGFLEIPQLTAPFPYRCFHCNPQVSPLSEMEFQIYFEIALKYGEVRGFPQACVSLGCRNFVLFKLECLGIIASNGRSVLV